MINYAGFKLSMSNEELMLWTVLTCCASIHEWLLGIRGIEDRPQPDIASMNKSHGSYLQQIIANGDKACIVAWTNKNSSASATSFGVDIFSRTRSMS